jgi:pilus assembly protein Flp/PilA
MGFSEKNCDLDFLLSFFLGPQTDVLIFFNYFFFLIQGDNFFLSQALTFFLGFSDKSHKLFSCPERPGILQQTKIWRFPMRKLKNLVSTSKGAALVEYGILVGLIAVLAIVAVLNLGGTVRDTFTQVSDTLSTSLASARNGEI